MMKAECPSNAQQLSSTTVNTLPQAIIENILCRLPIEEAAMTSILSREWRYKWTTIPKLEFDRLPLFEKTTEERQPSDIASAKKNMDLRCKIFNVVHQVLLMRQGPIHEFTFHTLGNYDCFELDQIISHLSRNHAIKKLRLSFDYMYRYKLPLCAFSLHQLTDLDLTWVDLDLDRQPIYSGFGSLRRLCLYDVNISIKALLHLLSNCPSLKSFSLQGDIGCEEDCCTVIELFECLPVIEDLTIYGYYAYLKWLGLDSVPKELPTSLIHLKSFDFSEVCFIDDHELTFLAVLIKCSPNLETIFIEHDQWHRHCNGNETRSKILEEEYSDVRLEHLKELKIYFFRNLKREMEFVKFILARSPKLKKVTLSSLVEEYVKSDMLKIILQAPHASPVEIILK